MNTIKKSELNLELLSRKEYADNMFIGYNGEVYTYLLDVLTSIINGNIINKFWVLKKLDENTFLKVPNANGGFIYSTYQTDGSSFKDINETPIPMRDEQGNVIMEDVEIINGQGETVIVQHPKLRLNEFTRNINLFAPQLAPSINITIDRYLGQNL